MSSLEHDALCLLNCIFYLLKGIKRTRFDLSRDVKVVININLLAHATDKLFILPLKMYQPLGRWHHSGEHYDSYAL